jgi:hypothetical protein
LAKRDDQLTHSLSACGCTVAVTCADREIFTLLEDGFGALAGTPPNRPVRTYVIERAPRSTFIVGHGESRAVIADRDSLLFHMDKELTLTLQHERSDLLFLHAAAVEVGGRVAVLAGPSGVGKSTLTLAAVEAGLGYLSDELAPIDLDTLTVHPYPHALCLKAVPAGRSGLPAGTLAEHGRFHVPARILGTPAHARRRVLAALLLLRCDNADEMALRSISRGFAAARLMENTLNGLAHPSAGLDAAASLSQRVPTFELHARDTARAVEEIRNLLNIGRMRGPDC